MHPSHGHLRTLCPNLQSAKTRELRPIDAAQLKDISDELPRVDKPNNAISIHVKRYGDGITKTGLFYTMSPSESRTLVSRREP